MAKLPIVPSDAKAKTPRITRRATLQRLDAVAQEHVGTKTPLDQAFAALAALGPDTPEMEVHAAQEHLRRLLAAGMDGSKGDA